MGGIGLVVRTGEVSGLKLSCISSDHQLTTDIEISESCRTGDDSSHISSFRGRLRLRLQRRPVVMLAARCRVVHIPVSTPALPPRARPNIIIEIWGLLYSGWVHNNERDSSVRSLKIMLVYITISHRRLHFSWVANCDQLVSRLRGSL